MKQFLIATVGVIAAAGVFLFFRHPDTLESEQVSNVTPAITEPTLFPTKVPTAGKTVGVGNEKFSYQVIRGVSPDQVKLIPNYEDQARTEEMQQVERCSAIVNGGFYGTDNKPLGWVVEEGKEISRQKTSSLFNGFVTIDESFRAEIAMKKPEGNVKYGLQTGPILVSDKKILKLSMARDKNARRMVLGIDTEGYMNFFAFYVKDAIQSGPMLVDLPELVGKAASLEGIKLVTAVNLDGGNAATFYNSNVQLDEISPVGSWWCINSFK
jgi:exopolysaccharide biosynthesis protein